MKTINYDEFSQVEIRAGTIVRVEAFPRAKKPAYKVFVDFGSELGVLQTSAQITVHYEAESLINRKVMGCVNLGEKNIAGFTSQFLLLGFSDINGAILLASVDNEIENGQKLH